MTNPNTQQDSQNNPRRPVTPRYATLLLLLIVHNTLDELAGAIFYTKLTEWFPTTTITYWVVSSFLLVAWLALGAYVLDREESKGADSTEPEQ